MMGIMQGGILLSLLIVILIQLRILDLRRKAQQQASPSSGPASPTNGQPPPPPATARAGKAPASAPPRGRLARLGSLRGWFRREEPVAAPQPSVQLLAAPTASEQLGADAIKAIHASAELVTARWLLVEPLQRHCEAVTLECNHESAAMRYRVDGVWHDGRPLMHADGSAALAALSTLAGIDATKPADRAGQCDAMLGGERHKFAVTLRTHTGGKRLVLESVGPRPTHASFTAAGLRDELRQRLGEVLDHGAGMLLLSAPPGDGLRTTTNLVLLHFDRLIRDTFGIEEQENRYAPVEAVEVHTYSAARGESPVAVLRRIFDQYPQVVVMRDLRDGVTVDAFCRYLAKHETCLAVSTVRAGACAEALARVLSLGGDGPTLAGRVTAVLNQRLIRKLCHACKQAYRPPAELVERLPLPPGVRPTFYRPPEPSGEVCPACGGLGYRGRTGLFELLLVDDHVRQAVACRADVGALQKAAQRAGLYSLQREGALLVAAGVTSLAELGRVLRQSHGAAAADLPRAESLLKT